MRALQTVVDALALGTLFALVAMGISLVFGVMRLVNFAYGELITAGAYALLLTRELAVPARVVISLAVVVALSMLTNLVLRPLRLATPPTMLVATFALSFLLQNVAILSFGTQGEGINFLPFLNQAVSIGSMRLRWITVVSIFLGGVLLGAMALILERTDLGLQMRAAAADFQTARLLGIRANRVILFAFVVSGFLGGAVTLALAVQRPLVTPTYGFAVVIPALVGVVVGGMDRLLAGTLGGFAIGFTTVLLGDLLPPSGRVFLDTALFALVITVLLVKPDGLFVRGKVAAERL
jgi:branched-chain amino acid transport system permease protein